MYKVLWVEDDPEVVKSHRALAEEFDLDLVDFSNWQQAEQVLRKEFDSFVAIILDANCGYKIEDRLDSSFLVQVQGSLMQLFGEKNKFLPWFVYSAGTMDMFETILELINKNKRREMEPVWGRLLYKKGVKGEQKVLFTKIKELAENSPRMNILKKYSDVFEVLDMKDPIQVSPEAKERLIECMLLANKYKDDKSVNIKTAFNPLRQVVEYLFRASYDLCILPDVFFNTYHDKDRFIMVSATYKYLCGKKVSLDNLDKQQNSEKLDISPLNPPMFRKLESLLLQSVIEITNNFSHTKDNRGGCRDFSDEDVEQLLSIALNSLCFIIKEFGRYVREHADLEENKKNYLVKYRTVSYYEGQEFIVERDGSDFVCDGCLIDNSYNIYLNKKVRLSNVQINPRKNKNRFRIFAAQVTLVE